MKEDTTEQDHDLHLGTVEEKVYNRYVGKHIQRQGHLEEFRVCVSRLSCGMWGEEKGGDRDGGAPSYTDFSPICNNPRKTTQRTLPKGHQH